MARPAKWKSPTTAIRVPERLAEQLLEIARSLESDIPESQADPEFEAYMDFVQNACKPKLLTVRDSSDDFRERNYVVQAEPLSFKEWQHLQQVFERLEQTVLKGLSRDDQLYLLSCLVQEVFPEYQEKGKEV